LQLHKNIAEKKAVFHIEKVIHRVAAFFDMVTSPAALAAAWERVAGNRGGPGGDGMTIDRFAAHAPLLLARLHAELAAGAYRPGPLRRATIPKRSGGTRILAIPCVVDRVAQSAVAAALSLKLDPGFSPDSFAYRPGRGVKQAVARVAMLRRAGYDHVVDGDIRGFFDAIPHTQLLDRLAREAADAALIGLVRQWLDDWDTPGAPGRGLAQGSPLSPLLANLYLDSLDDLFADGPVRIVRFADDFLLLAKGGKQAEKALAVARAHLLEHGLYLHPDKTRIVPFDQRLDFLGHLFIRSVVLEAELADQAEALATYAVPDTGGGLPYIPASPITHLPQTDEREAPALPPAGLAAIGPSGLASGADWDEVDQPDAAGARLISEFSPGLAPLYVLDRSARLAAHGECFEVQEAGQAVLRVPAISVGRVEAGPGVAVADEAIRLAADHGLMLSLIDGDGRALASMMPPDEDRAGLHLDQARLVLNEVSRRSRAAVLVTAKLRNQYALLKRLNRRRKRPEVEAACARIKRLCVVPAHFSLDEIRGREGEAAGRYWPALGLCMDHGFALRSRREEPANPVNAVLDWLSHLLTRDMAAATVRAGLHPGFGMLHASADRREALAYDLVEVFRAPLAEGLAVYLFNNRMLTRDDFVLRADAARLAGDAARRVLIAYESWIARPIRYPRDGRMTSWRMLIQDEARAFAASLRSGAAFVPYRMDW
jgi:CRISPR-associated protein Cas1